MLFKISRNKWHTLTTVLRKEESRIYPLVEILLDAMCSADGMQVLSTVVVWHVRVKMPFIAN